MKIAVVSIIVIFAIAIGFIIGGTFCPNQPTTLYNYIMIDGKEFSVIHDECKTFTMTKNISGIDKTLVSCFLDGNTVFVSYMKDVFISDTIGELLP
jgi:hypothetical protein